MEETKSLWKSKTFYINLFALIAVLATELSTLLSTGESVTVMVLLNLVLRAMTKQGIKLTP